jgi:hypothetical protein
MEMKVSMSSFITKKIQGQRMHHEYFTIEMTKGINMAYKSRNQLSIKIQPMKNLLKFIIKY